MRLPFLRPKNAESEPPRRNARGGAGADALRSGGDDEAVAAARVRARRRLVGAVVLLAIGVIGFPLLFDTQPRPLPLDTPIETPRREVAVAPQRPRPSPVTQLPADAGNEVAPPAAVPSAPAPAPLPAPAPAPAASKPAVSKPVAESTVAAARPVAAPPPAPTPTPAASAPAAAAGRFVVQVGAYTDAAMLREARGKVEKLGLKTYTQVIEGEGGKRTRVRLGPFATREEADAAAAKIKRAGLPAAILTL